MNNPFLSIETKESRRERLRKDASEQDPMVLEVLEQLRQAMHPDWKIVTGFYQSSEVWEIRYWKLIRPDCFTSGFKQPAICVKFVHEGYGYIEKNYFNCQRLNFPQVGDWQEEFSSLTKNELIKAIKDLHVFLLF